MINMKIMITGHRTYQHPSVIEEALNIVVDELQKSYDDILFISGGAIGIDQLLIKIALERNIPYDMYVPYVNQSEYWRPFQQAKYEEFKDKANDIHLTSNDYYENVFNDRNQQMVDACDFGIAVWDGHPSGTGNTVKMLKRANKLEYLLSLDVDEVIINKIKKESLDGFF